MTRDFVIARFAAAGTRAARGDHDLNPDMAPSLPLTAAAVLVALVDRPAGMTVLLTRRTDHLLDHAGQICFPGGRLEASDRDAAAAALREAKEEIGLPHERVAVIGRLDTYVTRTGFEVTPVVGLIDALPTLTPDPYEVAEAFEVPLAFLLDPANYRRHSRVYAGAPRHFHAVPWRRHYIWGATAGMLVNLREALRPAP